MNETQLSEINSKLESISNHQDFFKKKLLVLDKIETAILGNEFNKKGIAHLLDDHEGRISSIEDNILLNSKDIKANSEKISNWDKAIAAIVIAVVIFELTKEVIK